MKVNTKINGKDIQITLTQEQLAEIAKQTNQQPTLDDLHSYLDACKILNEKQDKNATVYEQLKMIIKAANYIDNDYKVWIADWNSSSESKYLPYFKFSGGGLVSCGYWYVWYLHCLTPVALHYKNSNTCTIFGKRFINLYNIYLKG